MLFKNIKAACSPNLAPSFCPQVLLILTVRLMAAVPAFERLLVRPGNTNMQLTWEVAVCTTTVFGDP